MFAKLEEVRNLGRQFKKQVKEVKGVKHIAGTTMSSSEGTTHSVKDNELSGFSDWINKLVVVETINYSVYSCPILSEKEKPYCFL